VTAGATRTWRCRDLHLPVGRRTLLMAIINVTPDSFSGDGLAHDRRRAVAVGVQAAADGADLLDVGGASTRPNNQPVSEEEELARVIPVVQQLAREVTIPISVDTASPNVAAAALAAGARVINDVSGLALGDGLARHAAAAGAGLVLMRFPGFPFNRPRARRADEGDLMADVRHDLATSVERALAAGAEKECLALDPGFGFGLLAPDSVRLLRRLSALGDLGFPLLVGVSRKGFTGWPERLPVEDRQWGTAAAHALAIANGADVLRVHDVPAARRVARFADLVVRNADTAGG
jgi:dihydropteroate synthase